MIISNFDFREASFIGKRYALVDVKAGFGFTYVNRDR